MFQDPDWPRAGEWLATGGQEDSGRSLCVLGAPLNASISPGRCELAPAAIREALGRLSTFDLETETDVRSLRVVDLGDVNIAGHRPEEAHEPIVGAMAGAVPGFLATVLLGGDNGITRPGVRGLAEALGIPLSRIGLLTLDAHLDVRSATGGWHNGNPVRALVEDGLPGQNVTQVGIAAFANSREYFEFARGVGIRVVSREQAGDPVATVRRELDALAERVAAVYVDVDVDVLDRAFAPACPGSRPGGFTPSELVACVRAAGRHPAVRAMDIVEIDPTRDADDRTLLVAGQCLLAFASGLLLRGL